MRYLVTGSRSGLGNYLCRKLNATGFTRESHIETFINSNETFDAIIHCAVSVRFNISSENFYQYMQDNLLLTQKLLQIPHKKFILISSVDIYPPAKILNEISQKPITESDDFTVDNFRSLYGFFKLMSEKIVANSSQDYLILRPVALLGKEARPNSLTRILNETTPKLTLAGTSTFNYILYDDVLGFITLAMQKNLQGIYNLAANTNISLAEVSKLFSKEVIFGDFHYDIGNVSNAKAASLYPDFSNTSLENIKRFVSLTKDNSYVKRVS